MNHLAHFVLSCEDTELMIGNFIADYIRNKEVTSYSDSIQKGIFLHRKIDTFTDQHPIVRQGTRRLQPHHGKYSPVILDVLYDNILIHNWTRYSDESLESFTQKIYSILQHRLRELPQQLQQNLPHMIADNWLMGYGTDTGLRFVFSQMDKRTRFPSDFVSAVAHFRKDYPFFEAEFNQFFPELVAFVQSECRVCD